MIHDLRHFASTMSARVGNLVETMQRLGHSTAKASLIYQGREAPVSRTSISAGQSMFFGAVQMAVANTLPMMVCQHTVGIRLAGKAIPQTTCPKSWRH